MSCERIVYFGKLAYLNMTRETSLSGRNVKDISTLKTLKVSGFKEVFKIDKKYWRFLRRGISLVVFGILDIVGLKKSIDWMEIVGLCGLSILLQEKSICIFYDEYNEISYKYAEEEYSKPKHLKKLFEYFFYEKTELPKIIIKGVYIQVILAVIHNVVSILLLLWDFRAMVGELFIYFFMVYGVLFWVEYKGTKKCFLKKFVRINARNIWYLFKRYFILKEACREKEPCRTCVGKCRICSIKVRGRKQYAEVVLLGSKKTYKKVLLRNKEKEYSVDTTGMLYETCGVFYLE